MSQERFFPSFQNNQEDLKSVPVIETPIKDTEKRDGAKEGEMLREAMGLNESVEREIFEKNLQSVCVEAQVKIEAGTLPKSTAEKIWRLGKKIGGTATGILALTSLAIGANHQRTRYETSVEQTTEGTVYHHEDPETTENLNILLGKEKIPPELLLAMQRAEVARKYLTFGEKIPPTLSTMNAEQLIDELDKWNDQWFGETPREKAEEELNFTRHFMKYDPKVAKIVWEIQEELGNPKIRWEIEDPEQLASREDGVTIDSGRAHYNSLTNIIYVNPLDRGETWLAEMAHGKQWNDNPYKAYTQASVDVLKVSWKSITEGKSFRDTYDAYMYSTPGTFEHEAHEVLEKEILEKGERIESAKKSE